MCYIEKVVFVVVVVISTFLFTGLKRLLISSYMAQFYYTPQGTVNAYTKNTLARIIYSELPSAVH